MMYLFMIDRYFAPEYFMHGIVDEKTDVYSFGVLLLEIITGRRALDETQTSIVLWVNSSSVKYYSSSNPITQDIFMLKNSLLAVSVELQAKPVLKNNDLGELVDHSLGNNYNSDEMDRVVLAASLCIEENPILRPRMSQASIFPLSFLQNMMLFLLPTPTLPYPHN